MNPKPRIGIVEDNQSVRESMGALIEASGYAAVLFDSAEAYMEQIESQDVACLVLDFDLPGMNALGLMQKLHGTRFDAPTIIVSGTVDAERSKKLSRLGALAVICKPVAGGELMKLVHSAIGA
jgi:FixJ family two-component response regulator